MEDVELGVEAERLITHGARHADQAAVLAECAAALASGGFGAWWHDGDSARTAGLVAHISGLAERLTTTASSVGGYATSVTRRVGELDESDRIGAQFVRGLP
ncbi:hypothetical protein [Gordonia zhaorongruii]|uniref:hypothetical protein n=1 Tax=Gordonia zhaorongruii TaxID=2597659 RepID=UPI00117C97D7|nr:hypothetical protein [Gordonia zhaorongruii]